MKPHYPMLSHFIPPGSCSVSQDPDAFDSNHLNDTFDVRSSDVGYVGTGGQGGGGRNRSSSGHVDVLLSASVSECMRREGVVQAVVDLAADSMKGICEGLGFKDGVENTFVVDGSKSGRQVAGPEADSVEGMEPRQRLGGDGKEHEGGLRGGKNGGGKDWDLGGRHHSTEGVCLGEQLEEEEEEEEEEEGVEEEVEAEAEEEKDGEEEEEEEEGRGQVAWRGMENKPSNSRLGTEAGQGRSTRFPAVCLGDDVADDDLTGADVSDDDLSSYGAAGEEGMDRTEPGGSLSVGREGGSGSGSASLRRISKESSGVGAEVEERIGQLESARVSQGREAEASRMAAVDAGTPLDVGLACQSAAVAVRCLRVLEHVTFMNTDNQVLLQGSLHTLVRVVDREVVRAAMGVCRVMACCDRCCKRYCNRCCNRCAPQPTRTRHDMAACEWYSMLCS